MLGQTRPVGWVGCKLNLQSIKCRFARTVLRNMKDVQQKSWIKWELSSTHVKIGKVKIWYKQIFCFWKTWSFAWPLIPKKKKTFLIAGSVIKKLKLPDSCDSICNLQPWAPVRVCKWNRAERQTIMTLGVPTQSLLVFGLWPVTCTEAISEFQAKLVQFIYPKILGKTCNIVHLVFY